MRKAPVRREMGVRWAKAKNVTPIRSRTAGAMSVRDGRCLTGMRRFTRLTNGFSKKIENDAAAVALHLQFYNFARPHKSGEESLSEHPGDGCWRRGSRLDLEEIAGLDTYTTGANLDSRTTRGSNGMLVLSSIGGVGVVVVLIAWRIRRYQRDIDDYEEREYRDPPVFGWPGGTGGAP